MREKQYILYKEGKQIGNYTKKQISVMLPEIDVQALVRKGKHDSYELKEMYEINDDGTFTCICYECGKSFIHECNKNLCPECRKEFDIQTKKRANERKKIRLKKQRREKKNEQKNTIRRYSKGSKSKWYVIWKLCCKFTVNREKDRKRNFEKLLKSA